MKIVFTTDTIQRGGKERQLFILSDALIRKGYSIDIITLKWPDNNYLSEYNINSELVHLINEKTRSG